MTRASPPISSIESGEDALAAETGRLGTLRFTAFLRAFAVSFFFWRADRSVRAVRAGGGEGGATGFWVRAGVGRAGGDGAGAGGGWTG
jgi:hypothetical protein